MAKFLPNGIGETLGDVLVTCKPLLVNGDVWWVDSENGDDTYAGNDRHAPFATLAAAVTASASGDIIVLAEGHDETITVTVQVNKSLTIVGAGSSGGYPTATLTNDQASDGVLDINADYVQILNIYFAANAQTNAAARIYFDSGNAIRISGCYFECGAYDGAAAILLDNPVYVELSNNTYLSTATDMAARPYMAVEATAALNCLVIDGDVYDGGTVGFSSGYAVDVDDHATIAWIRSVTCLRSASITGISGGSLIGYANIQTSTGGVIEV